MKAYNYEEFKKERLSDPHLKAEYDFLEEEFTLSKEIIQLRKDKNLTQKELAHEIGSSQPAIARLESGNYRNLSLSFLRKVATALDAVPEVHLKRKAN
ncbi:XRE family transcriptional regulator [Oceanispirochaeta crateris]|uniref:XRE family transcriptional regulator n=1 Tax=Oceanispirochaeta crateris TaxID=2518645 RepID=A0A5C1QH70_9SPIO|nr:helix-turn-helix transcriptional regulator [Oceanispirochaeta crateris]QEN06837.1 XRE family transcriptional regulator [Oceanispirochaeta crateris]